MKPLRMIVERKEPVKKDTVQKNDGGYQPDSPDGKRFVDKHVITSPYGDKDVYGNGPEVYRGEVVKPIDRGPMHGYNPGDDAKVYEELDLTEACDEDRYKAWKHFHNHAENTLTKIAARLKKHRNFLEKTGSDGETHVHHPADQMRDVARALEDLYMNQVTSLKEKPDDMDSIQNTPIALKKYVHGTKGAATGGPRGY